MFSNLEQLFWYRLVFLLELLIAEFLFCKNLKRRSNFVLRLILSFLLSIIVTIFFPLIYSNPYYISLMFIVIFISTLIGMYICFNESFWNVLFCGIAAYTVQHIAYTVYSIIVEIFYLDQILDYLISNNPYVGVDKVGGYSIVTAIAYFTIYFCVYWIFYFTFASKIKKNSNLHIKNVSFIILSGVVIMVDVIFNMITVFNNDKNLTSYYLESLYNLISCFIAIELQFSQFSQKKIENELQSYKVLWSERNNQYEISKKTIDIINIKCHDLKHQIHNLKGFNQIDENNLKEIDKTLKIYDSSFKTGNKALDVILTEKSLLGTQKNINFNIIADGKCLSFINPPDIYSLFGNAIENAIEALSNVEEDKKTISLMIKQVNKIVIIHLENYYQGDIKIENGLPKTKKDDENYHGFGMLSMKEIVEKYHGNLTFEIDNNIFKLNIIFPLN